ncbi:MAG: EAL domain-containing protein [Pseudomonadota bacterium]
MIDRMLVPRQGAMARVILAIALFVLGPTAWGNGEVRELTLGVLSYQEPGDVRLRWQPLADYLSERVPGIRVRVRPLMRHDAEPGLARGELQLLLINPYDYAWLEASHGVTRIATLRPRGSGDTPPMFGAVVFQRADAPPLEGLEALRDKRVAAIAPDAFPTLMVQREIQALGHEPQGFFGPVDYTGLPHVNVVERVLAGQADAGIVRSGLLEALVAQGRIPADAYRIVPAPFPVAFSKPVSTRLYPEWPMAIAPGVEPGLARRILHALLEIEPQAPVAVAADIDGFAPPLEYSGVSALMHELGLGPFARPSTPTLRQVVREHWPLLGLMLAGILFVMLVLSMRSNRRLKQLAERLDSTLDGLGDAVVRLDAQGRLDYMNPVAENLWQQGLEQVRGRPASAVLYLIDPDSGAPLGSALVNAARTGRVDELPQRVEIQNHIRHVLSLRARLLGEGDGLVLALHDITAITSLNEELRWQANHDPLTALYNQRALERAFVEMVKERTDGPGAMLALLDLDDFKAVNDQAGHAAGDELLRQMAEVLKLWSPEGSLIARLAGDEFIILLRASSVDDAVRELQGLVERVSDFRLHYGERDFQVGASIGVVTIDPQASLEYHLIEADAACMQAKEQGGDRVQLHSPGDAGIERHHADLAWVTRLREALNTDAFILYGQLIQPTTRSGEPHCEVLLRLPDGQGLAAPGSFIPAAERQRMMPRLDRWVVRQALRAFAPCQDAAVLAVNLSAQSVQDPRLGDDLVRWFEATGVRPDRVCFEITETTALDNLEQATSLMRRLQALGCRFALDDFGSGLFSFGMLRSLPVDYLKIDGKLVREFRQDAVAEVMLGSILELGRLLDMQTIAEWVEDGESRELLTQLGVDYLQGYVLHRPAPLMDALSHALQRAGGNLLAPT